MEETAPAAAPDHQKGRVVLPASPAGTSGSGEEKVNGAAQPESDAALPPEGEKLQSPPKAR